jgi:putative DNA methylase
MGSKVNRRLIELSIPLDAISAQSAREKSIRHGHISTLHIWWARRPLAACRAAVFAALVDAPEDDAERERLERLIATIVDWDQVKGGNSPAIEEARRIVREQWGDETPRVLDVFAGGGAIPLEALRLGCEAHALELNPVAYLILLCTLVYPQRYADGVPGPAQPPEQPHLPEMGPQARQLRMELEQQAGKRTLASDVERWGRWVLEEARKEIGQFYEDPEGGTVVAYLWARTAHCPNPACGAEMPLVRQWWLARRGKRKRAALKPIVDRERNEVAFEIVQGDEIDFDPAEGTIRRGSVTCLFCGQTADADYLRSEGKAGRLGQMPLAVVLTKPGELGKAYRPVTEADRRNYAAAEATLERLMAEADDGLSPVPDEPLPKPGTLGFRVNLYGFKRWGQLFNARQALALVTFTRKVRAVYDQMLAEVDDQEYARAVATCLVLVVDRLADYNTTICTWHNPGEKMGHTFTRQALPMAWDYCELNPFSGSTGDWSGAIDWVVRAIEHCAEANGEPAGVRQGTATRLPHPDAYFHAVITDPPYYDAVPYADLSDFFYVWLKRTVGDLYPAIFRTPLTPKSAEIIQEPSRHGKDQGKAKSFYEAQMTATFREAARVLRLDGTFVVVFAHKTTAAWETLVSSLLKADLVVTASWPLHTEMAARLRARESAALASSIFLVCRKRAEAREGYFSEVRQELQERIQERLEFFWEQGIRGADFFISAIGPAVEVFGRYTAVRRLSGEQVTVSELLDLVQEIVADYALARILHDGHVGHVDPATRFYVLWRWAYGAARVHFDDARKLAQAQGAEVDRLMARLRLLKKRGENIELLGPRQRAKAEHLGEAGPGGQPAPLIDVLHRAALLWNQGDRSGLAEFLSRSGYARDETFWVVAQALSEILPEGDKEKQMLQGLLGSRERVVTEARQERLWD